jgi:hypothetical protein
LSSVLEFFDAATIKRGNCTGGAASLSNSRKESRK